MRTLRWICGNIQRNILSQEYTKQDLEMTTSEKELGQHHSQKRWWWFGHLQRRPMDYAVRRVDQMEGHQITRGRGRPRKTIREPIKKDQKAWLLLSQMVL